jgi:hypothetical protein
MESDDVPETMMKFLKIFESNVESMERGIAE